MSESKGGKLFKKHTSRRRSRSTETPGSFLMRDEEGSDGNLDELQRDDGISNMFRESPTNSTKNDHDLKDGSDKSSEEVVPTSSGSSKALECAICLQPCVHPARLPCLHVFCFLCLKGIARGAQTCAMCRAPIPPDYTENPELVPIVGEVKEESDNGEKYTWFYEGRSGSGWWQYDTRTSSELEQCYQRGENKTEVLIAGYLYIVDFEEMMQSRKNEPAKRRGIKRDLITCPKKGIAGLRQPVLSGLIDAFSRLDIRNN